jgi:hypothetical protein
MNIPENYEEKIHQELVLRVSMKEDSAPALVFPGDPEVQRAKFKRNIGE